MKHDNQIYIDNKNYYGLVVKSNNFIEGYISARSNGFGCVLFNKGKNSVFLSKQEMQKVLHGDFVRVRILNTKYQGKVTGVIIEVISRANTHIVGRLFNENGIWKVTSEDKRIFQDILVINISSQAQINQIVSVEIITQPSNNTRLSGRIVEILGNINDPGIEVKIAVRKYGVPYQFSHEAQIKSLKLPHKVTHSDLMNRVDLRSIPLVTIDNENAKDFDDAIYCEPIKISGQKAYRLIVAIADVSHYVEPNDALDIDAFKRSTSIYFPHCVIPMLPEQLSNNLCSLHPNIDRLALVCDVIITIHGKIQEYKFYSAVIHSVARLTYTEVTTILSNHQMQMAAKNSFLAIHLLHLNSIFKVLSQARRNRGAIDLDISEVDIICNAMGKIKKIIPRVRNHAHYLVEECMLVANFCAADLLQRYKHPGLYRVHAGPTIEKLSGLRAFLKKIGLHLDGGDTPTASDYAKLMPKIKARPDSLLIQTILLRSMQQAIYSVDNIGHFGLSYAFYTHFTSPIRRYSDLLTHRIVKAILKGQTYMPKLHDRSMLNSTLFSQCTVMATEKFTAYSPSIGFSIWKIFGTQCSINERRAEEASRDVEAWLKCYFIRDKLGEEFSGTISGVTAFGIFVQLDILYIEGMIHVTKLGKDYFYFDPIHHELRGERTGVRYQLTDRVKVQISQVDLSARRINLQLIHAI